MLHPIRFYKYWFEYNAKKLKEGDEDDLTVTFFFFGALPLMIGLAIYTYLEPFFYSSLKESYQYRKKRFKKFMESYKNKYDE